MEKGVAIEILRKNFEKWTNDHLETLRFLTSQLYKLFDSIIAISVAVVGIIIPIILSSDYPINSSLLWASFSIFVAIILIGIFWRFVSLKIAENKWPKILQGESENFYKSVSEIKENNSNNFLGIIEKNFHSGINKNAYRTKAFEVVFIILFCLGIILLSFSLLPSNTKNSTFQEIGVARLGLEGQELKLLVADTKGQLGKIFLFSNNDDSISTTLSVENPNIESPSFRVVKGHAQDWLVVTTIENSGTGYLKHVDTWYVANTYYRGSSTVLSYPSDGHITGWTRIPNQKLMTNVSINADDTAIDIEFVLETCGTKNECAKTTKVAHYVWSSDKAVFLFDEKKSQISILEISNLLTVQ